MNETLAWCPICKGKLVTKTRFVRGYIRGWDKRERFRWCCRCKVRVVVHKLLRHLQRKADRR